MASPRRHREQQEQRDRVRVLHGPAINATDDVALAAERSKGDHRPEQFGQRRREEGPLERDAVLMSPKTRAASAGT